MTAEAAKKIMDADEATEIMRGLCARARDALPAMAGADHDARNMALRETAKLIRGNADAILAANKIDLANAHKKNMAKPLIGRLTLNANRIEAMAKGLDDIVSLPDPLGVELSRWQVKQNGLDIARVSTPLGVIGVIYESRPNVTIDAGGLAVKSGNPVILRGGSDSFHTSQLLTQFLRDGLAAAGLPVDAVQSLRDTDRALVGAMLAATGGIDVIVPRGGRSLVERVQFEARVPVFAHLEGICHVYIDKAADHAKAIAIAVNSKMRRVEICGAAETLLVDKAVAETILPQLATALRDAGCVLRCDDAAQKILGDGYDKADASDWTREYLDAVIAVAIVDGVAGAISHIARHGSNHTEAIITEDAAAAEQFTAEVDSAIVMVNASTQFADGGEFGMGAEIGIATGRLHARGPVGAAQLTAFKYVVRGTGQIREDG